VEKIFIDKVSDQYRGLQEVLRDFRADAIIGDDMFFGLVPMLLGARGDRPAVLVCGTSILHSRREDKAPLFIGLPPAVAPTQFKEYEGIAREYDQRVDQPSLDRLNGVLKDLGVGPLTMPLFEATVALADTYLQLSVPGFEFPRTMPSSVNFIGALPIIPGQAPLPSWANDLNGKRKVVLVTQGTVANHDFGLLVGPTLTSLADEPDILVVATAGGRSIDAIPGPIPDNARLAEYLPFEWLLPKVDVLVTNGGYGSVNQALSFGIPIVAAGLTEDKADVNARIAWSGAGIDLKTNNPTPDAIQAAVRTALDTPECRRHARRLAAEFATFDAKTETLRLLRQHEGALKSRAA
jgi:UDP:flavonoid glycosyltransferase YjiC (YdhE family)